MGDGFQFLDILFLAMVAAFLILRLRSVLGRRPPGDGLSKERPQGRSSAPLGGDEDETVVPLPGHGPDDAAAQQGAPHTGLPPGVTPGTPLAEGLAAIAAADPGFAPEPFLDGARVAFETIVRAFAAGDTEALRPLLSEDVFEEFAAAIQSRKAREHRLETTLIGIRKGEIVDARLNGGARPGDGMTAEITVRIVSDQVNVVTDKNGAVVEGDPNYVAEITDLWTFARPVRARNPNWILVATAAPQ